MTEGNRCINICYCFDSNYWYPVLVSAFSAVRHCSVVNSIVFHFVYQGVPKAILDTMISCIQNVKKNAEIKLYEMDDARYRNYPLYHNSRMVYYRLDIPNILCEIDWVLMADGDTLWLKSPEEVWKYRDNRYEVIGSYDILNPEDVAERLKEWDNFRNKDVDKNLFIYFCMGFCLLNLKALRDENFGQKVENFIAKYGMPSLLEQDVFNILCAKKQMLPYVWGIWARYGHIRSFHIYELGCVHYVGDIPWIRFTPKKLSSDLIELWWQETKRINVDPPEKFKGIHNSLTYWALRMLFLIWKNCSFLWSIKFLRKNLGWDIPIPD